MPGLKPIISDGNMKLGGIPNLSLLPGTTCRPDAPCIGKLCYARKALIYPETKDAWLHNTYLALLHRAFFFRSVREWIEENKPPYFRWHVGGDIPDEGYLEAMCDLAVQCPGTRFMAFTKRHEITRATPDNLQIVFSLWPRWPQVILKYRRYAHMQDGTVTIPKTRKPFDCPGNCSTCAKDLSIEHPACWMLREWGRDVVFMKH